MSNTNSCTASPVILPLAYTPLVCPPGQIPAIIRSISGVGNGTAYDLNTGLVIQFQPGAFIGLLVVGQPVCLLFDGFEFNVVQSTPAYTPLALQYYIDGVPQFLDSGLVPTPIIVNSYWSQIVLQNVITPTLANNPTVDIDITSYTTDLRVSVHKQTLTPVINATGTLGASASNVAPFVCNISPVPPIPGFCRVALLLPTDEGGSQIPYPFVNPPPRAINISILPGPTLICNVVLPGGAFTPAEVNTAINGNGLFNAFKIANPGSSIICTNYDNQNLTLIVTVPIDLMATDATMQYLSSEAFTQGTFVCTPVSTKKKNVGGGAPYTFCCKPEQFKGGICPPKLRTMDGTEYVNRGNGCYVRKGIGITRYKL